LGVDGDLSLEPEQPEEVVRALEELLGDSAGEVDPWWRAGNDEALET
jgi:hypothetical protein